MKLITLLSFPLLLLISCTSTPLLPAPRVVAQKDLRVEKEVHNRINSFRASKGLSRLKYHSQLADIARQHSVSMSKNHQPKKLAISHDGFFLRVRAARYVGMGAVAENVGATKLYHSADAPALVKGWVASKGHLRNIIGNYEFTGVGVHTTSDGAAYATQLFARKKRAQTYAQ